MVQRLALLGLITVLSASSASALIISGSGDNPPGGGSCSWSGIPTTGTGATLSCTGIAFGSQSSIYIGIDNAATPNGLSMVSGSPPAASGAMIYRSSSTGASSITYTSTTTITSANPATGFGTDTVANTLSLTRTAGTGAVIATGGTPANNTNGDIGHLFRITAAGSFTLVADADSTDPHFSGQSCSVLFDGTRVAAPGGFCHSRVDIKFYWSTCGDGVHDSVGEQCDDGGANGTAGSCCTTSCTFKSAGTQCTDSSPTNCKDAQCTGVANVCDQNFANEALSTPCTGNGTGQCTGADTCNASGTCLNNDFVAGTPCTDTNPTSAGDCKDAQCNGSNVCDQNFANETDGTGCADGDFCNGSDQCSGGLCNVSAGDPCDGPGDADTDCSETCVDTGYEVGNCNGVDTDGSFCTDGQFCTGTESCTAGSCGGSSGDPCSGPDNDNDCQESCDEVGDNCVGDDPNGSPCNNGSFCDGTETCTAGTCGGSTGDPCPGPDNDVNCSESCDEGADNCLAADTDGTLCRADAGDCDVQETCLSGSCPADTFEPALTACGDPSDTDCTNPDTCDGGGVCEDNHEAALTACGDPSDTDCTNPDTCDGSGTCEANHELPAVVCRAATTGGLCDEAENCDGAGNCPADAVKPNGVTCRAPTGDCDVEEECDGVSPFCDPDGFEPALTPCGSPTDTDCDNPDTCDGNNTCLSNLEPAATACGDPSDTDCTNPDTCDGAGTCEDNHEAAATACGDPSDTDCTNPDTCDGGGACLINDEADGTTCGDPSDTDCSNPDTCLGGACDGNHESTSVLCRAATSGADCNEPEFCDGAGNCPADDVYPSGTVCRATTSGDTCDEAEVCDGISVFCPADGVKGNGEICRAAAGDCDVAETCNGLDDICPTNAFASSGDPCGSGSDTNCDNPDTCDGSGTCEVNNEINGTSCDDSSACTGGDVCTGGVCSGPIDLCPDLDHYKCYQGKDLKDPKFLKLANVETDDQIVTDEMVEVKKLKFVCTPVDKNGEGINAPGAHLACYQLKAPKFAVRPKVEVSTQFQTSKFEIKKGKLLCLPATKTVIP